MFEISGSYEASIRAAMAAPPQLSNQELAFLDANELWVPNDAGRRDGLLRLGQLFDAVDGRLLDRNFFVRPAIVCEHTPTRRDANANRPREVRRMVLRDALRMMGVTQPEVQLQILRKRFASTPLLNYCLGLANKNWNSNRTIARVVEVLTMVRRINLHSPELINTEQLEGATHVVSSIFHGRQLLVEVHLQDGGDEPISSQDYRLLQSILQKTFDLLALNEPPNHNPADHAIPENVVLTVRNGREILQKFKTITDAAAFIRHATGNARDRIAFGVTPLSIVSDSPSSCRFWKLHDDVTHELLVFLEDIAKHSKNVKKSTNADDGKFTAEVLDRLDEIRNTAATESDCSQEIQRLLERDKQALEQWKSRTGSR